MIDVPMEKNGQASGSQSTVRQIGSALGIAVLGTILFSATQGVLESKLTDLNVTGAQQTSIVKVVVDSAGGAIPQLEAGLVAQQVPQPVAASIVKASGESFSEGARWTAIAAALFLLLGLLSTFNLSSRKHSHASNDA
jgi:hypothetical protein